MKIQDLLTASGGIVLLSAILIGGLGIGSTIGLIIGLSMGGRSRAKLSRELNDIAKTIGSLLKR